MSHHLSVCVWVCVCVGGWVVCVVCGWYVWCVWCVCVWYVCGVCVCVFAVEERFHYRSCSYRSDYIFCSVSVWHSGVDSNCLSFCQSVCMPVCLLAFLFDCLSVFRHLQQSKCLCVRMVSCCGMRLVISIDLLHAEVQQSQPHSLQRPLELLFDSTQTCLSYYFVFSTCRDNQTICEPDRDLTGESIFFLQRLDGNRRV